MLQHAKHDGSAKASASLLLCVFVAGWVLFAVAAGGACAAEVDLAANAVKISYDMGKVNLDDFEKAITDAGYEVVK